MAKVGERVFAIFFAGLFAVTLVGVAAAAVYQTVQDNKKADPGASAVADSQTAATNKEATVTDPNSAQASTKLTGTVMQGFTATTAPQTELKTIDTVVGTGETVKAGAKVTANYVGALMSNGVVFDASADHGGPIAFPLSGVIAGWSQGIPGMKVGGTRRLLIPSNLAYGSQGNSGIPPNADLVFDVTITKVEN